MATKERLKVYTLEEVIERSFGPIGSPTRIALERDLEIMHRRHESALKAAQTRKRNREEALRLAKEKEQQTQSKNTIEYIVKIETDSRKDDLVQVPLDLLIEQEKHLPLNR